MNKLLFTEGNKKLVLDSRWRIELYNFLIIMIIMTIIVKVVIITIIM